MAKQDEWKRITLRLPTELYDRIAGADTPASINARIVEALEQHYPAPRDDFTLHELFFLMRDRARRIKDGEGPEEAAARLERLATFEKAVFLAVSGEDIPDNFNERMRDAMIDAELIEDITIGQDDEVTELRFSPYQSSAPSTSGGKRGIAVKKSLDRIKK